MGHNEIDVSRVVPAPPAAVFAILLDRSSWPGWSGHRSFEPVRPGAAGPHDVGSIGLLRSGRRRVVREEIVEVVPDRRIGYTLLAGLPLRNYRADFDLTPTPEGTEVRWHSRFDAPPGFGWIYVVALRRFTARMLEGLSKRVLLAVHHRDALFDRGVEHRAGRDRAMKTSSRPGRSGAWRTSSTT